MTPRAEPGGEARALHDAAVEAAEAARTPNGVVFDSREDTEAIIRAYLAVLAEAGWKVVPIEPTPEMLEAGTKADWIGEGESRDGLSIMPYETDDYERWYDLPDGSPLPKKMLPGIWPEMLRAAPLWPPVNDESA